MPPHLHGMTDSGRELQLTPPAFPDADGEGEEALADFMGALVMWMMDVTLEALDVAQA